MRIGSLLLLRLAVLLRCALCRRLRRRWGSNQHRARRKRRPRRVLRVVLRV